MQKPIDGLLVELLILLVEYSYHSIRQAFNLCSDVLHDLLDSHRVEHIIPFALSFVLQKIMIFDHVLAYYAQPKVVSRHLYA